MKALHAIAFILVIVGGLNWGLVGISELFGLGNWNVVNLILGGVPALEAVVYILVGVSAVYEVVTHKKNCRMCGTGSSM